MPLKPVDTAIKVIVGPLIDDTDFKSREEAVAYNAAGMEIDVIVEKADGTITTTAVTPTTSGDYDWTHTDQGYYQLELPASGGASCNNAEEGMLTVVGYATGVLPFRSQSYDMVPVKVYNSLVKGTDNLEVDQVQLGGSTQSATDLKDFADTGYDPVTHEVAGCSSLSTTERNAVADAVLGRSVSNVESTADEHSLCTVVLATLESSVSGTTWTIAQTDGSTQHASKTVTLSAGAYPITAVE